ncbi:MAG: AAA family ATPase [Patescibacteria group bacterium]
MNKIIAIVGMAGAGKTEATKYLETKNIPFARFGQITDETISTLGLPLIQENERMVREKLRQELGMAAYAIKMKPRIDKLLKDHDVIVLDGLYSWEEYTFLKKELLSLILIHVFAEPPKRYERLSKRAIRPLSLKEARGRDIAELEELDKGGPIAIADYIIVNNGDDIKELHREVDKLLKRLGIDA